jgi:hypothetical protein
MSEAWRIAGIILTSVAVWTALLYASLRWFSELFASKILEKDRRKYAEELERVKSELEHTRHELQARLDKTVYVHKMQWDVEFAAVSELWTKVTEVRFAFLRVRPVFDRGVASHTEWKDLVRERANALGETFNQTRMLLDTKTPFIPQQIFDAADLVLVTALKEANEVSMLDPDHDMRDYWTRAETNKEELIQRINELARRIRERLAEVSLSDPKGAA